MSNVVCKPGGSLGVVRRLRSTFNRRDVVSSVTLCYCITYSLFQTGISAYNQTTTSPMPNMPSYNCSSGGGVGHGYSTLGSPILQRRQPNSQMYNQSYNQSYNQLSSQSSSQSLKLPGFLHLARKANYVGCSTRHLVWLRFRYRALVHHLLFYPRAAPATASQQTAS